MGYTGFHGVAQTPISEEISLAEMLLVACMMRYGSRDYRMLRTDPAKVFSMMCYHRCQTTAHDDSTPEWKVVYGVFGRRPVGHPRPTNNQILTPSHARWQEFRERLGAELLRPDFDFWYAPQRFPTPVGVTADFWPLCSAQLLGEMGFAIAETLAVFGAFRARTDEDIREFLEGFWHRATPHRRRPAFDSEAAGSQDASQTQ
jgi:hypothetical protein